MENRSHRNHGLRSINALNKKNKRHSASNVTKPKPDKTVHAILTVDCLTLLKRIPDNSIQLIICDPPYNILMAEWDQYDDYTEWAIAWLLEAHRVLKENGNFVIFGGIQYQSEENGGDLLSLIHEVRKRRLFNMVNMIIWNYPNGMGAQRFFANRHEEIVWFTKSKKYYFDLDAVREPFDEAIKALYLKDKRLRPDSVKKAETLQRMAF